MRLTNSFLLALTFLPLTSCVMGREVENDPLDPARIQRLQPGKTTAKEVVDLLGAPAEVVQLHKRSAYRYEHTTSKYAGLVLVLVNFGHIDKRSDRLWVFFDENDTLTSVGSTLSSHRTQYALPWENVHEKSDSESRDMDRFGPAAK